MCVALALMGMALAWWLWPQPPKATSREAQDHIKRLYTACNRKDPAQLAAVAHKVEEFAAAGTLTEAEEAHFRSIIGMAVAGDWASAEDAAFRFAKAQVNR
jgi:hypothetical protein